LSHISFRADVYCSTNLPSCFPLDYVGPLLVIISSSHSNDNVTKINPVAVEKFLSKNFRGVLTIIPAGLNQVKITFDSIKNANECISSEQLKSNGYTYLIPSSLLYCFSVIRLNDVSEEDFWGGCESPVKPLSFRRISVKKYEKLIPTRFVEIKFQSSSLPKKISIFKVLFDVSLNVRSPTQCNNCLKFGHTQKCCRGKLCYGHCG